MGSKEGKKVPKGATGTKGIVSESCLVCLLDRSVSRPGILEYVLEKPAGG